METDVRFIQISLLPFYKYYNKYYNFCTFYLLIKKKKNMRKVIFLYFGPYEKCYNYYDDHYYYY